MSLDVFLIATRPTTVFNGGMTHNLARMAAEAGVYQLLWRPEDLGITHAHQLLQPLQEGLLRLVSDPARFQQFDPENGWGAYEELVEFTRQYHAACLLYPDAEVRTRR